MATAPTTAADIESLPRMLRSSNIDEQLGTAIALATSTGTMPACVAAAVVPVLADIVADRSNELPHMRGEAVRCLANLCGASESAQEDGPRLEATLRALGAALPALLPALLADMRAGLLGQQTCACPGCGRRDTEDFRLQRCSRCKHAWYCGPACIKKHWAAGHQKQCTRLVTRRAALDTAAHPCQDADLAFVAAALLANATRAPMFVCGTGTEHCLADAVPALVDITARHAAQCAAMGNNSTGTALLGLLANLMQSAACRSALVGSDAAPLRTLLAHAARDKQRLPLPLLLLLRNLCLDTELHRSLLPAAQPTAVAGRGKKGRKGRTTPSDQGEVDVPGLMLATLQRRGAGTEEAHRVALEALLALASCRAARENLITRRAYPELRDYHRREKDDTHKELVNQIVDYLARDSTGDGTCPVAVPLQHTHSSQQQEQQGEEEKVAMRTQGEIEKAPDPPALILSRNLAPAEQHQQQDDGNVEDI